MRLDWTLMNLATKSDERDETDGWLRDLEFLGLAGSYLGSGRLARDELHQPVKLAAALQS